MKSQDALFQKIDQSCSLLSVVPLADSPQGLNIPLLLKKLGLRMNSGDSSLEYLFWNALTGFFSMTPAYGRFLRRVYRAAVAGTADEGHDTHISDVDSTYLKTTAYVGCLPRTVVGPGVEFASPRTTWVVQPELAYDEDASWSPLVETVRSHQTSGSVTDATLGTVVRHHLPYSMELIRRMVAGRASAPSVASNLLKAFLYMNSEQGFDKYLNTADWCFVDRNLIAGVEMALRGTMNLRFVHAEDIPNLLAENPAEIVVPIDADWIGDVERMHRALMLAMTDAPYPWRVPFVGGAATGIMVTQAPNLPIHQIANAGLDYSAEVSYASYVRIPGAASNNLNIAFTVSRPRTDAAAYFNRVNPLGVVAAALPVYPNASRPAVIAELNILRTGTFTQAVNLLLTMVTPRVALEMYILASILSVRSKTILASGMSIGPNGTRWGFRTGVGNEYLIPQHNLSIQGWRNVTPLLLSEMYSSTCSVLGQVLDQVTNLDPPNLYHTATTATFPGLWFANLPTLQSLPIQGPAVERNSLLFHLFQWCSPVGQTIAMPNVPAQVRAGAMLSACAVLSAFGARMQAAYGIEPAFSVSTPGATFVSVKGGSYRAGVRIKMPLLGVSSMLVPANPNMIRLSDANIVLHYWNTHQTLLSPGLGAYELFADTCKCATYLSPAKWKKSVVINMTTTALGTEWHYAPKYTSQDNTVYITSPVLPLSINAFTSLNATSYSTPYVMWVAPGWKSQNGMDDRSVVRAVTQAVSGGFLSSQDAYLLSQPLLVFSPSHSYLHSATSTIVNDELDTVVQLWNTSYSTRQTTVQSDAEGASSF